MSPIAIVLFCAILALAAWRLVAPHAGPRLRLLAAVSGLALAGLQLLLDGFTWQFTPAYALLAAAATPPFDPRPLGRWLGRLALAGLFGLALAPWILLPVPGLPQPNGTYPVATRTFRWVDATRAEPATADPTDRRNVIVQAWYPSGDARPGHLRQAYIDGLGRLPPRVSLFPAFVLARFGRIDTHAAPDGPLPPRARPWPVIVFSPGYGAPRAFYTGLVTQLASRGFVVLALDHPYEAAVTELADGRVVGLVEHFQPNDPDRTAYMAGRLEVRAADVGFVLDQIARPGALGPRLSGRLDLSHVAAAGHSFGGATAAAALDRDPRRLVAAVNIDGTPYGSLPDHSLKGPFLLLQSDYAESHHSARFLAGNGKLLEHAAAPSWRFEIRRANHYSFTDAPLFFSPPGRLILDVVLGGERGAAETQQAGADILAAFLAAPLGLPAADVAATAARYPGIVGGPITPRR